MRPRTRDQCHRHYRGWWPGLAPQPFPNVRSDPCDYSVTLHDGVGHHCAWTHCPGCGPPLYAADESCLTCAPSTTLARLTAASQRCLSRPVPGIDFHKYAVEDTVRVPADLPAGDYVLGYATCLLTVLQLHLL